MIVILIGKSSSGKDTMMRNLVRSGMTPIVSYTSRPKRKGEVDGKDYHFVSKEQFIKLTQRGVFMEYRSYDTSVDGIKDTWYYGTPWINPELTDYVTVLEITAAKKFLEVYGPEKCRVIYLMADDDVRERRAKKRGSFNQCEWDRRLLADAIDFSDEKINELASMCSIPMDFYDNNTDMV